MTKKGKGSYFYSTYLPYVIDTLKRDHFRCVDCKSKDNLVVHHIDESRRTGILNNDPNNLVTLCRPCHARRHGYTNDYEDVVEMRRMGMSLGDIGKKIGVSRQRIYQVLRKNPDWKLVEKENFDMLRYS